MKCNVVLFLFLHAFLCCQVINDCDNWWNQFLTILGFLHIW